MPYAVYLVFFSLVGLTLILLFVQWASLSSLSSRIRDLEQEVDKKAQEFDSLRREKQNVARQPLNKRPEPSQNTCNEPEPEEPVTESGSQQSGFQETFAREKGINFPEPAAPSSEQQERPLEDHLQIVRPTLDDHSENDIIPVVPRNSEAPVFPPDPGPCPQETFEDSEPFKVVRAVNGKFTDIDITDREQFGEARPAADANDVNVKSEKCENNPLPDIYKENIPEGRGSNDTAPVQDLFLSGNDEPQENEPEQPHPENRSFFTDLYNESDECSAHDGIEIQTPYQTSNFNGSDSGTEQQPSKQKQTPQSAPDLKDTSSSGPEESPTELLKIMSKTKNKGSKTAVSSTLPLYSDAARDADFTRLCKMLSGIVSTSKKPDIKIDFAGIQFIYDKELEYLQNIYHIVNNQGGSLSFINCSPELSGFLSRNPVLLSLISKNKA
ncbi:MAG: hypothetical protein GX556_15200 [Fibrobacter sp.]|nr:hypothetical protein [Fibrobacter sp.]